MNRQMRRSGVLGALAVCSATSFFAAGCGSTSPDDPTATPVATATAVPTSTSIYSLTPTNTPCPACTCPPAFSPTAVGTVAVVVNEVFTDGSPGTQFVELRNTGASSALLTGYQLCLAPFYWGFPAGFTLNAGAFVVVHWNQTGTNTATDLYTGTGLDNLAASSGEMGFYACTNFTLSSCIRDYLEWGTGGHTRESVAAGAGIWSAGSFAASMTGGMSLHLIGGTAGNLGCHYQLGTASPGS